MTKKLPRVTLSNGLRVVNFSSAHEFVFTDGSVLGACTEERSCKYRVGDASHFLRKSPIGYGVFDVEMNFFGCLSDCVLRSLRALQADPTIDVILCSHMMCEALRDNNIPLGKCRSMKKPDRNSRECMIDQFCV